MNTLRHLRCLKSLLFLGLGLWMSYVSAQPQTLTLLGRSYAQGSTVKLSEADSRWLQQKSRLVLAVSAPDYPPFDITTTGHALEGVTADYAGLLKQLLQVEIDVQRYGSREEALQALKQGTADLLGTANSYEAQDPQLQKSSAYAVGASATCRCCRRSAPS